MKSWLPAFAVFLAWGAVGCFSKSDTGVVPTDPPNQTAIPSGKHDTPAEAAFKAMPPQKQQFVVNEYQLALNLYINKEFDKAQYELDKLHGALPQGYRDSKDLEVYARKGIDLSGGHAGGGAR